jgi:hypothetical protein
VLRPAYNAQFNHPSYATKTLHFASFKDWTALPDSARALFARGEQASVFFSREWFENLCASGLDSDQPILLACVLDADAVMALLPLLRLDDGSWSSLTHRYSSLYTLLIAAENQSAIVDCLARGIAGLPIRSLRLEPFARDDAVIMQLQQALQTQGFDCHRAFRFYNWFHRVQDDSFEAYMAGRPSRLRNTIARKQRKLEREQDCALRLYSGDRVVQVMKDYHAAYQASWKASELFGDIVDGMTGRFSRRGWSRLGVLYISGQPAAAQLWFVAHRKATIFRLAYDETWKRYSPGSILTRFLMRQVIDVDRVGEIDFLMGNERYKQDWMSSRRERWGMHCARRTPSAGWWRRLWPGR